MITAALTDETPTRSDGSQFNYVLLHGETMTGADSLTDLVGTLVPGHRHADDPRAVRERAAYVVAQAVQDSYLSASYANRHVHDGFDVDFAPSHVRQALFARRSLPFVGVRPGKAGPRSRHWTWPVPLALVTTHYSPHTGRTRPTGDIVWIDAATDETLLASLEDLGLIAVLTTGIDI